MFSFSEKFKIKNAEVRSSNSSFIKLDLFKPINRVVGGEEKIINTIHVRREGNDGNGYVIDKDDLQIPEGGYLKVRIKGESNPTESWRASDEALILKWSWQKVKISKVTNEERISDWIDDNFNLNIDYSGNITNPDKSPRKGTINKGIINFETVFQKIENYVREHPNQFSLSKDAIHARMPRGVLRTWWNPLRNENSDDRMITNAYETDDSRDNDTAVAMRLIQVQTKNGVRRLHPNAFSQEQFEKLKNLLPNDISCKKPGCYNNYCRDRFDQSKETKVENGLCGYHRAKQGVNSISVMEIMSQARETYENSNNLTEISQAIINLENAKKKDNKEFSDWQGELLLDKLKRKLDLELNNQSSTNNNNSIQVARNNAIREIKSALDQEPKITTADLSTTGQKWEGLVKSLESEKLIGFLKAKILREIDSKRKAKKEAQNIINNLKTEGKSANQLQEQLMEVQKSGGQQCYEDNQSGINNLKEELFKKISREEYRQIVINFIGKILIKYNIGYDELNLEVREKWEKLKKGESSDFNQINEIEQEVSKNAGEKGARKKLITILEEAQNALKNGKNIDEVREKIVTFLSTNDIYEKAILSKEEKKVELLLSKLENYSFQNNDTQPSSRLFRPKIIIPSILVLLIATVSLVILVKKRTRKN